MLLDTFSPSETASCADVAARIDGSGRMVKVIVWNGLSPDPRFWVALLGIAMRAAAWGRRFAVVSFPVALQMVFAICAGGIMACLSDTPRRYYAKGYQEAGDETLCRIFDATMDGHRVHSMRSAILASIELQSSSNMKQLNFVDLIWDRSSLRASRHIRISFLILAIQQMMGQYKPLATLPST